MDEWRQELLTTGAIHGHHGELFKCTANIMRVLKNLFGDNAKIHTDNIIGGTKEKPLKIGEKLQSAQYESLSVWLLENTEPKTYGGFNPAYRATGLPSENENWRYSAGFYLRRTEDILHIILIARDGQIATRSYHDQWYSWKVFS